MSKYNQNRSWQRLPITLADLKLAEVEIEDVLGDSLTDGVKLVEFKTVIKKTTSCPSIYGNEKTDLAPRNTSCFKSSQVHASKTTVSGVRDGDIIVQKDAFTLTLQSQVRAGVTAVWELFNHWGVNCVRMDTETMRSSIEVTARVYHRYGLALQENIPRAHIQFICTTDSCEFGGRTYRRGDILNFYIYRNIEDIDANPTPPAVCVIPQCRETFVVMRPQQFLQIITTNSFNVDYNDSQPAMFVRVSERHHVNHDLSWTYFLCRAKPVRPIAIWTTSKVGGRQHFINVVNSQSRNGISTPVLLHPPDHFDFYPNGCERFTVVSRDERIWKKKNFLDQVGKLRIESWGCSDQGYEIRFKIYDRSQQVFKIRNFFDEKRCILV